ncbi:hypothetical protein FB45DRAFT_1149799, partial [Roridomyces roridus]
ASPLFVPFDSEFLDAAEPSDRASHNSAAGSLAVTDAAAGHLVDCLGVELTFPPGESHHTSYPFGLHAHFALPWDYYSRDDHFYLRAKNCTQRTASGLCRKCQQLKSNDFLVGIMDRIVHGINENAPALWFPIGGLVTKIRRKNDQIQVMRLAKHNDMQTLTRQSAALDRHKEFVMAVGSGKVARIAPLVRASLNNNKGINGLVHRFHSAAGDAYHQGPKYRPHGYTQDERMLALCTLRIGGARLTDILHRALGLPGLSTVRKNTVIRPLRASAGTPTVAEIVKNIEAYTVGEDVPSGPPVIVHRVIMFDEIAVNKRPRWDDATNMIIGGCREHDEAPRELNDIADAERFFRQLEQGKIHLASEATVVALGALSRDPHIYNARPICISGTCKTEDARKHVEFLRNVNTAANQCKNHGNILYRTVSFASDGEARHGLALALEFLRQPLAESSPIHPLLSPLRLMNLLVGPDDITPDRDFRHVLKNTRGLLMRKAGVLLRGFLITPAIVKQHLRDVGLSRERADRLLNPNDKQDVSMAYELLRELWSLPETTRVDPGFVQARRALRIFGRLAYHLMMPYICITLSLREQLVHLSAAAHLLIALFITDDAGTKFMANQTFSNIMLMIKNAFFCVAKAKVDIPDSEFFLILLGTDRLETLFGLIRTIIGADANCDVYQLANRASNVTEVSVILGLRPHWDRGPRRLKLPAIINEQGEVGTKADHVSPTSWLGDVHVANVGLHACWMDGREVAEEFLPEAKPLLARCDRNPSVNILSPFGHILVGAPDAEDAFEPDAELFRPDPEEENDPEVDSFYTPDGDFEDEIAIEIPRKKSPHITFEGKMYSKATILSQMMQGRSPRMSTDRLRRVAGMTAFKSESAPGSLITTDIGLGDPALRIGNPIATLVHCEGRDFLAIAQINRINCGTQDVDTLLLDLVSDAGTKVSFQILRLVPASLEDDPEKQHDWRWSLALDSACDGVPGALIQPLNPTVSTRMAGNPTYLLSSELLLHVASQMQHRLTSSDYSSIPEIPRSDHFPYRHNGKACFAVEYEDKEHRGSFRSSTAVECTKCDPPVSLSMKNKQLILQHNGAQILFDPNIRRSDEPCGLCLRVSSQQGEGECSEIDWTRSKCLRVLHFKMGAAQKFSPASPRTNHLIPCPVGCGATIWTYHIEAHLRGVRHNLTNLDSLNLSYQISSAEHKAMRKVYQDRRKVPQTRKKKTRPPLQISEGHSSLLAFRNLNEEDPAIPSHSDEEPMGSDEDDSDEAGSFIRPRRAQRTIISDEESSDEMSVDEEHIIQVKQELYDDIPMLPPAEDDDIDREIENTTVSTLTNIWTLAPNASASGSAPAPIFSPPPPLNSAAPTTVTPATATTNATPVPPSVLPSVQVGRGQRRKRRISFDSLDACTCGIPLSQAEQGNSSVSIRCTRGGCETVWYHLECVDAYGARRPWVCKPC